MQVNAGPPLEQLAAGRPIPPDATAADLWLIHQAVVRCAEARREDELSVIHRHLDWVAVPTDEESDDGD